MEHSGYYSIMQLAKGKIMERVDSEVEKVFQNILNPRTKATDKRKITVTIELKPDEERQVIGVTFIGKSTLAPELPEKTELQIIGSQNGEMQVAEVQPQIPGQTNMNGMETEQTKYLKIGVKQNG